MTHGKMKGRMELVPCELGEENNVQFTRMSQRIVSSNMGKGIFNNFPSIPGKTGKQRRAEKRAEKEQK